MCATLPCQEFDLASLRLLPYAIQGDLKAENILVCGDTLTKDTQAMSGAPALVTSLRGLHSSIDSQCCHCPHF